MKKIVTKIIPLFLILALLIVLFSGILYSIKSIIEANAENSGSRSSSNTATASHSILSQAYDELDMGAFLRDSAKSCAMSFVTKGRQWIISSVMESLGYSGYEHKIGSKLTEINSKIDNLELILNDTLSKLQKAQQNTVLTVRMNSFASEFANLKTSTELNYDSLVKLNKKSGAKLLDAAQFTSEMEYLIKLIYGVNKSYDLNELTSVGAFVEKTLNFAQSILPSTIYTDGIFDAAADYFEYPVIWAHDAYSARAGFRTAVLCLYEKARELCELALNYRLSMMDIKGAFYSEDGKLLIYTCKDNIYCNFNNSQEFDTEIERLKKLNDGGNFNFVWITENGYSHIEDKNFDVCLDQLITFMEFGLEKEIIYKAESDNYELPTESTPIFSALKQLKKDSYDISQLAFKDMNEMKKNSEYCINLKLDDAAAVAFNRYNTPFLPKEIQTSGRYEETFAQKMDDIKINVNCTYSTTFPGYSKTWVNPVFAPTNLETFKKFLSLIPAEYKSAQNNKTLGDYLKDVGFMFYKDKEEKEVATDVRLALGCVTGQGEHYKGFETHLLSYVCINTNLKLFDYKDVSYSREYGYELGSYELIRGGKVRLSATYGFMNIGTKYTYSVSYDNALYNIGFPCSLRYNPEYSGSNITRFTRTITSDDKGMSFGFDSKKGIYEGHTK